MESTAQIGTNQAQLATEEAQTGTVAGEMNSYYDKQYTIVQPTFVAQAVERTEERPAIVQTEQPSGMMVVVAVLLIIFTITVTTLLSLYIADNSKSSRGSRKK